MPHHPPLLAIADRGPMTIGRYLPERFPTDLIRDIQSLDITNDEQWLIAQRQLDIFYEDMSEAEAVAVWRALQWQYEWWGATDACRRARPDE